jgi:hypothetical protein
MNPRCWVFDANVIVSARGMGTACERFVECR